MSRFDYYQSVANRQWYWRLVDGNNQIVATGGEGYTTEQGVLRAIRNIRLTVDELNRR